MFEFILGVILLILLICIYLAFRVGSYMIEKENKKNKLNFIKPPQEVTHST